MRWNVLFDAEFTEWLNSLDQGLQDEILAHVELLQRLGPTLGRPRVDSLKGSTYRNMKELRIQYHGDPWRILFAFDPRRAAILLVGGRKGDKRWYHKHIRIADQRFKRHLDSLQKGDR